jgi:anaerobic magnesium-protoporphyrin IX monomethyl ester cyclase
MAFDVLLLQLFNSEIQGAELYAPIGISYVAGSLRSCGYRVRLELLRSARQDLALSCLLERTQPSVVGISSTGHEIPELKSVSLKIRQHLPSVPIVAGGYCSLVGEKLFENSAIDVVVIGEGEETMSDLLPRLLARESIADVRGILHRANGTIIRSPARPVTGKLDRLPQPDYWHVPRNTNSVRVYASRGCPYDCAFCDIKEFYSRTPIRYHSPTYIKALISSLTRGSSRRIEYVYFNDDEFLLNPDHLRGMAAIARELRMKIIFQTRTRDVICHRMAIFENREPIHQIHMGVESFSQSQLDRWRKRVSVAVNRQALQVLSEMNVSYIPYLILSDKHTTVEELQDTCNGIVDMPSCPYAFRRGNRSLTLPMSPLHRGVEFNRYKSFYGEVERDCGTAYLDAVWDYLRATQSAARSLRDAYLLARFHEATSPATDGVAESARASRLLDERIRCIPEIARRAKSLDTCRSFAPLVKEEAAHFLKAARRLQREYTERLYVSPSGLVLHELG